MLRRTAFLCLLSIAFGAGCDIVVGDGEITVLGNGGTVLGSNTPNAVTVLPGGGVGVEQADVIGRGRVVTQGMASPPSPGAGLVSNGGAVVLAGGRLLGGNVIVQPTVNGTINPTPPGILNFDVASPAELAAIGVVGIPFGAAPSVTEFGRLSRGPLLAPGLVAQGSVIEIQDGAVISSSVVGQDELYIQVPALIVKDSELTIRGGEFRLGQTVGAPQIVRVIAATFSDIEISGGVFTGGAVLIQNSRTRITGGRFLGFSLGNFVPLRNPTPLVAAPGCTEIRGGQFQFIGTTGSAEQIFIFGTGFNLPFGPIPIPPLPPLPSPLPPNVQVNPSSLIRVDGTLEDGTTATFIVSFANGPAQFILAPPGSPGCGFGADGPIDDDVDGEV